MCSTTKVDVFANFSLKSQVLVNHVVTSIVIKLMDRLWSIVFGGWCFLNDIMKSLFLMVKTIIAYRRFLVCIFCTGLMIAT
ncbi:hypothetical protein ACH3XW_46655 [Acanthocheilonema viteae]